MVQNMVNIVWLIGSRLGIYTFTGRLAHKQHSKYTGGEV